MKTCNLRYTLMLTALCLLTACAGSGPQSVETDAVEVQFADDVWQHDSRGAMQTTDRSRATAERALSKHLSERVAKLIPAKQKLEVRFTRIDRAGDYEGWRGPAAQDVRIVRDIYPPRIDLTFRLLNAEGATVKAGSSQLRDLSFMMRTNMYPNDSLRYEKALLDDWVRREFQVK